MAERIDLPTPAQSKPGTPYWRPVLLVLDDEAPRIKAGYRGANGEWTSFSIEGATAATQIVALNKANLPAKSLKRRMMEYAITNGHIPGTISGTPD